MLKYNLTGPRYEQYELVESTYTLFSVYNNRVLAKVEVYDDGSSELAWVLYYIKDIIDFETVCLTGHGGKSYTKAYKEFTKLGYSGNPEIRGKHNQKLLEEISDLEERITFLKSQLQSET